MLQRIQTIWLFLVAACAFASLKFSVYSGIMPNDPARKLIYVNGTENVLIMAVTLVVGILALFTIFMYKNRKQQLRVTLLNILLEGLLIFLYYREIKTFTGTGAYALSSVLQIAIILSLILAARAISKDEKLVKDSDRLR